MRFLGWPLFLISLVLLFVGFLTLGNSNFTANLTLQHIGQIIGIITVPLILINFIIVIVRVIGKAKKRSREMWEKKTPSEKRAIRIKRLVGFLIWIWLFVIFPLIGMYWNGILSEILNSDQGSAVGTIIFTILVIIGTVIPSIFLSSLKIYLIPLFLLSFYFVFAKNRHKLLDLVFYILIITLTALQIWKFSSITNPETESEQARASIEGENKVVVTIMDINKDKISGVEICFNLLEDASRHKCQNSGNDGKVTFMLKPGYYKLGFGSQSQDFPGTTTPEFDIKDGQTIETELIIGK
jgi:hypothetical protein